MKSANWTKWIVCVGAIGVSFAAAAAQQPATNDTTLQELRDEVRELHAAITEMREETAQYRAETAELRRELMATRNQSAPANAEAAPSSNLTDRVAALEEDTTLLNSKVDDQYQTKVESASKYRVRLSGMALLNLFGDRGPLDNTDFPSYVPQPTPFNSSPAIGATMRQSQLAWKSSDPR